MDGVERAGREMRCKRDADLYLTYLLLLLPAIKSLRKSARMPTVSVGAGTRLEWRSSPDYRALLLDHP